MSKELDIVFIVVGKGTSRVDLLGAYGSEVTANKIAADYRPLYAEVEIEAWLVDHSDAALEILERVNSSRKLQKDITYAPGDFVAFEDEVARGTGVIKNFLPESKIYVIECEENSIFDKLSKRVLRDATPVHLYIEDIIGRA